MNNFKITLKQYNNEDYEFVYNTKKVAYEKYVIENWNEWNEDEQRKMFVDFINTYKSDIYIIMCNNEKIGFYHCEELENNGYEIGNICIIPKYQRKGIGTKILKSILEEHKNQDIYLRYFKQNPVVNLYKKLGFEIIEEMPYHFKMVLRAKNNLNNENEVAFHKKRIAFLIIKNEIKYLIDSPLSHKDWAIELGIDKETFENLTRGYYLDNNICFYKGNFSYDNQVIIDAKKYSPIIKKEFNINKPCKIYCGVKVGKVGDVWPPDLFIEEI